MKFIRVKGKVYRVKENPFHMEMRGGTTYTEKDFQGGSYAGKHTMGGKPRTPTISLFSTQTGRGIRFKGGICQQLLIGMWVGAAGVDESIRDLGKHPGFKKLLSEWGTTQR
jgi:hypothetical protein